MNIVPEVGTPLIKANQRRHGYRSFVHRMLWTAYLAGGGLLMAAYYLVRPLHAGPTFNMIGASSVVAIALGARLHRPRWALAWYLVAAGQALFVIGDVLAYNWQRFFGTALPFPSAADVFYVAVYPCVVAGLVLLIHARNPKNDAPSLIDSLILSIGAGVISWVFLMAPYAHDQSLSVLTKLTSIAYPLMDILVLAVSIRLAVGGGRREPALYLLLGSILSLLATDSIYGWLLLHGGYSTGGILDIGWGIFYLGAGAAALHPSMRSLSEQRPDARGSLPRGRLALLASAALMVPGMQALIVIRHMPPEQPVTIAAATAVFVLVVARMNGLVKSHSAAELRERSLREAGAAFVSAADREQIYAAAIEAVGRIAPGARTYVYLYEGGPSREANLVAASSDASGKQSLNAIVSPHAASTIAAGHEWYAERAVPSGDRGLGGLSQGAIHAVGLPLGGAVAGVLVTVHPWPLPVEARDAIGALASQAGLALETASLTEDLHRRKSEARFGSLVQHASDLMTVVERDSTIRYQSPSIQHILGYDPDELIGTKLLELVHPDDQAMLVTFLDPTVSGQDRHNVIELRWRHRDGSWGYFETLSSNLTENENVRGIVFNTRDVTERKQFEQQLSHQAFHDSITGLANRALFQDRVKHALERSSRTGGSLSVIFMDLDDFKMVNDSMGHAAGDAVLRAVGERIQNGIRSLDTAARLGGDEFGMLIEDADPTAASEVAERVMQNLERPFHLEGKDVFVRASLGIATTDGTRAGGDAEELLRNADVAMYIAKTQGKARYQMFEPAMHASVMARLELKADLERALAQGEFVLLYQPILDLRSRRVVGLEALLRWQHPTKGWIQPMDFIGLAEETGSIVAIGRWVLHEACRAHRHLREQFPGLPLTMSVNVSARQLQSDTIVEDVRSAMAATDTPPASLILELTESVMMADTAVAVERLSALKGLGVQLAVDDFGTGYSSLNYLRQFPIDVLKIDRTFVKDIREGGEVAALAESIVDLARVLNLRSVAEGIEEEEQLDRLTDMDCQYGQGFFFFRPMPLEQVERQLDDDDRMTSSTRAVATTVGRPTPGRTPGHREPATAAPIASSRRHVGPAGPVPSRNIAASRPKRD